MSSIQAQLKAIAAKSMVKAEKVAKESYFDTMNIAVIKSPVDKGLFRSNWNASYQSIDLSLKPIGNNSSIALQGVLSVFDFDRELLFTESLPYAKKLEDGNSAQAPVGMVKVAASSFQSIAQSKINKYRD